MSSIVDYIRANAAGHARESIDSQLRAAGHADDAIAAAWSEALLPAPPVGTVSGGGPAEQSPAPSSGAFVSTPVARLVAVVAVAFVAIAVGVATTGSDEPRSARTLSDEALVDAASDITNVDRDVMDAALDQLGGEVEGTLPEGWEESRDGLWIDMSTGNNVNLIASSRDGLATDTIVAAGLEQLKLADAVEVTSGPTAATLGEYEGTKVELTQGTGAMMMHLTQWYVEQGDDLLVITMTIAPNGGGDVAEARRVAEQVRPA